VAVDVSAPAREQTRARYPDESGIVVRLGGIDTGHAELLDWIDGWLSK
jgi:hypothetical protein